MKQEEIKQLFEQFEAASSVIEGLEVWSVGELYPLFGYSQWRNFQTVIDKAKATCENVGNDLVDHFADVSKMIKLAKGAERQIDDVMLIRCVC